jgi:hypothetical protein
VPKKFPSRLNSQSSTEIPLISRGELKVQLRTFWQWFCNEIKPKPTAAPPAKPAQHSYSKSLFQVKEQAFRANTKQTMFKRLKSFIIEAGKVIGVFLLLLVLIMGLSSFILFLETKKFPFVKSDDGRALLSLLGGFGIWNWILWNIRRANMNDNQKRYFDKRSKDGDSDDDL